MHSALVHSSLLQSLPIFHSAIGPTYGVPHIHFKGLQNNFYIMVSWDRLLRAKTVTLMCPLLKSCGRFLCREALLTGGCHSQACLRASA